MYKYICECGTSYGDYFNWWISTNCENHKKCFSTIHRTLSSFRYRIDKLKGILVTQKIINMEILEMVNYRSFQMTDRIVIFDEYKSWYYMLELFNRVIDNLEFM